MKITYTNAVTKLPGTSSGPLSDTLDVITNEGHLKLMQATEVETNVIPFPFGE